MPNFIHDDAAIRQALVGAQMQKCRSDSAMRRYAGATTSVNCQMWMRCAHEHDRQSAMIAADNESITRKRARDAIEALISDPDNRAAFLVIGNGLHVFLA